MIFTPTKCRQAWQRIVVAILLVALAFVVRTEFLQELGTRLPYLTFDPAVVVAALFGGLAGGILATVLSLVLADPY